MRGGGVLILPLNWAPLLDVLPFMFLVYWINITVLWLCFVMFWFNQNPPVTLLTVILYFMWDREALSAKDRLPVKYAKVKPNKQEWRRDSSYLLLSLTAYRLQFLLILAVKSGATFSDFHWFSALISFFWSKSIIVSVWFRPWGQHCREEHNRSY